MFDQKLSVKRARYALVGIFAAIFLATWSLNLGQGTDDRARQLIGQIAPSFQAWLSPIWAPSSRLESALFLVQSLIGISLFSYVCLRLPSEPQR